jgi:hypothetical protein
MPPRLKTLANTFSQQIQDVFWHVHSVMGKGSRFKPIPQREQRTARANSIPRISSFIHPSLDQQLDLQSEGRFLLANFAPEGDKQWDETSKER